MVAIRAEFMRAFLGGEDPHAALFAGPGARRYALTVHQSDARLVGSSLARFDWFGERMASAAAHIDQFLFLGVGCDTRALWLPAIAARGVRVIEVDLPDAIERKIATLAAAGIACPARVVPVGIDLASPALPSALMAAGFDPSRPAGVFMEGVTFQLPPETALRLLDPGGLGLAPGSRVVFDFWTRDLVARRSARFGSAGKYPFPLPEEPSALSAALAALGYRDVSVVPLSSRAAALWPDQGYAAADWYLVEATVA